MEIFEIIIVIILAIVMVVFLWTLGHTSKDEKRFFERIEEEKRLK